MAATRMLAPLGAAAALVALLGADCGAGKNRCVTDLDCLEGFTCQQGICSAVDPVGRCDPNQIDNDGCDAWSVCVDQAEFGGGDAEYRCQRARGCELLDLCGASEGICNAGLVAEKERICLIGRCTESSHCEMLDNCVFLAGEAVGICHDGSSGHPCDDHEDCRDTCAWPNGNVNGRCASSQEWTCADRGGTCVYWTDDCPAGRDRELGIDCPNSEYRCCL